MILTYMLVLIMPLSLIFWWEFRISYKVFQVMNNSTVLAIAPAIVVNFALGVGASRLFIYALSSDEKKGEGESS